MENQKPPQSVINEFKKEIEIMENSIYSENYKIYIEMLKEEIKKYERL